MAQQNLQRSLSDRHIQLISIGGAIGVGLFLGSAKAIQIAGPSILLSYALGGIAIFLIMRALGEMVVHKPISGSFSHYAAEYIGPWAGFVTGWTYWFLWVVTGMAEITAVGVYVTYWFPEVPQWIPALFALIFVYAINLIAVRLFGEFEFWFALIKVVTILAMIAFGLYMIFTGSRVGTTTATFANLWVHEGFFPKGISGTLLALQAVLFAFLGVELVGVTAGEAKDPKKTLPSAINNIIWRILIFYIGALAVILSIFPWNQLDGKSSPFVLTFAYLGIPAAAGIINFVVLTAALSSCNSGVFSTGRMLYTLSHNNQAPKFFGVLSKRKVPANAIGFSALVLLLGVFLNYVIPEKAFIYVTSVATVGAIWTWGIILYSHIQFRKKYQKENINFRLPGSPWTNYIGILFLLMVTILLALDEETRIALIVAPIWFGILALSYVFIKKKETE